MDTATYRKFLKMRETAKPLSPATLRQYARELHQAASAWEQLADELARTGKRTVTAGGVRVISRATLTGKQAGEVIQAFGVSLSLGDTGARE